ncbi:hypothetical protein [Cyanobium sp. HWJ4-Hawea]|nr:hypothetical protein [Cyanobium sp. HWJ4-Hawea]
MGSGDVIPVQKAEIKLQALFFTDLPATDQVINLRTSAMAYMQMSIATPS